MIKYLHVPNVPFLPISSEFLVEESKNHDLKENPAEWLQAKYNAMSCQLKYAVEPCSSEAMYRLADLYNLDRLRDLSLGFIVRSLTVENVRS